MNYSLKNITRVVFCSIALLVLAVSAQAQYFEQLDPSTMRILQKRMQQLTTDNALEGDVYRLAKLLSEEIDAEVDKQNDFSSSKSWGDMASLSFGGMDACTLGLPGWLPTYFGWLDPSSKHYQHGYESVSPHCRTIYFLAILGLAALNGIDLVATLSTLVKTLETLESLESRTLKSLDWLESL